VACDVAEKEAAALLVAGSSDQTDKLSMTLASQTAAHMTHHSPDGMQFPPLIFTRCNFLKSFNYSYEPLASLCLGIRGLAWAMVPYNPTTLQVMILHVASMGPTSTHTASAIPP
jgi:hypothetical protein